MVTFEADDARPCNIDNILKNQRYFFYEWNNEKGIQFRRGRALVFYDQYHKSYAEEMEKCFFYLDYKTKMNPLNQLETISGEF